ncbi:serine/threonine protein kinase [Enterococcus faecalis]|nr:serine/threonine protein kinase [Enterococcus faecalis]EGO9501532.1 serine/threonine protein kinase [Enterococcus faecalis]EHU5033728.1 serine/threonine protein kinase [Enterococcus faecalis]
MLEFETLLEQYENIKKLASGGQKVVYSAEHPLYGAVVLKICKNKSPRLEREIEIITTGRFENSPKIFDFGEVQYYGDNTMYIVEEKIVGTELRKFIDENAPIDIEKAIDILEQGLQFIQSMEEKNIVHRDIKPENIMINSEGKLFFLDFGIARVLNMQSLTMTEAVKGPHSLGYSVPEQIDNIKDNIDSRADIFSLGVVVYECLTGKNPFVENAISRFEVENRTKTMLPTLITIPGDENRQFLGLLNVMMAKFPSQRPSNAKEALLFLQSARNTIIK